MEIIALQRNYSSIILMFLLNQRQRPNSAWCMRITDSGKQSANALDIVLAASVYCFSQFDSFVWMWVNNNTVEHTHLMQPATQRSMDEHHNAISSCALCALYVQRTKRGIYENIIAILCRVDNPTSRVSETGVVLMGLCGLWSSWINNFTRIWYR